MASGLALWLSDLRGFLRLYRDRDRARPVVRLPAADQFQPALHFRFLRRILDTLAYFLVDLATHVSLHPARRQPPRYVANLSEHHDRDGTRRPLAWRGAQLSHLGRHARRLSGARAN